MSSLFTKIIQGEIPCHKVLESDTCFAFMDIRPVQNGHVLVVPKVEIDRFFDLSAGQLADIMAFTQQVAVGIKRVFPCDRVGMSVIGLEVPHAHIHLVPINSLDDMNFSRPKGNGSSEHLKQVAIQISEAIKV
ncbi:MAG TPA: HIT family protein [Bacteroidetes bacterium]|nr:HIT family protein [Bacteroidota bacterium]|tara:strand:+ start:83 stop:481 length:399 start_codon:yes stop_codon:yes gene_type:complete